MEQVVSSKASNRQQREKPRDERIPVVKGPKHYRPGEYVTASVLCGCFGVCVGPLDDE